MLTAARASTTGRLLSLLHLLCLLRMSLRQLLRLLLVLLLHLLNSLRGSILFGQLLMLVFLLLLEVLPLLGLLGDYACLLFLVFLVQRCVPRVGSGGALDGRQFLGMGSNVGARSRRNWWGAVVRGNPLLRIAARGIRMLSLSGYG